MNSRYKLVLFGQSTLQAKSLNSFLVQGGFPRFCVFAPSFYWLGSMTSFELSLRDHYLSLSIVPLVLPVMPVESTALLKLWSTASEISIKQGFC